MNTWVSEFCWCFHIFCTLKKWRTMFLCWLLWIKHYYILIELDSYFMIDLVFILFVKSLDIFLCLQKKHWHIVLNLEDVSETSSVIYEIYHLQLCIVNQWNYSLEFIQSFIVVDHNTQDSQILLDRSVLKDFKINICNDVDAWKFEWKLKMTEIFSYEFVKKMISTAHVFSIWTVYKLCLDDDNNKADLWDDNSDTSDNLTNMSKILQFF